MPDQSPESRLWFETLVKGTDEKVVYALLPSRETMQGADNATNIAIGTLLSATKFSDWQGCDTSWRAYKLSEAVEWRLNEEQYTRFAFTKD